MTLPTAYTDLVGCRLPLQQAPMGSVSSPELAVAVADAGAVGSMTVLGMKAATLDAVLDDVLGRTVGVLTVNFLTAAIDREALAVAASRLPLVDFFWSDPDPAVIELAHAGGARVSWQVGSADEARAAVDAGADVVVVQGVEAGGHVRATGALLPSLAAVLDAVDVPVLAAGGIGHPRALAAVLAAGAAGARIGTAFIATHESGAHAAYKNAVVAAGPGATTVTDAFARGCPLCATSARHRVLTSSVVAAHAWHDDVVGETTIGTRTVPVTKGSPLSPAITTTGGVEAMALYAGEGAAAVDAVYPAGEVVRRLCDGAAHLLAAARTG